MNVIYTLVKMKASFFNIIVYLICCQCLVLRSLATEDSTVSSTKQTIHLDDIKTEKIKSATNTSFNHDTTTAKVIYVNQKTTEGNNTVNNTNETKSETKLSSAANVSQGTTEPSKECTASKINEKTTNFSEEQSTKPMGSTEGSSEAPGVTETFADASSPSSCGEEEYYPNDKNGGFDGPSFVGGIILTIGLIGFGYIAFKFCSKRTNINYRNV